MNSNPYSHLLEQNQNQNQTRVTQPQQQQQYQQVNTQAYVFNPQQYVLQQQQVTQYSPYNQYNTHAVIPLDADTQNQHILQPITATQGITNKNSFMLSIVIIYILQYSFQLGFIYLCMSQQSTTDNAFLYNNQITGLFWVVLLLTVFLPIVIFNTKGLQNNLYSAIFIIIYLVVYAGFQVSLLTIASKKSYDYKGNSKHFGDFILVGIVESFQICFNIVGLLQLIVLAILLKIRGDNFTFKQFYVVGVIVSILSGIPFYQEKVIIIVIMVASIGILFSLWFSFGLRRVSDSNFGLKQEQVVFGSFSVYVVMSCPCVTKV